MFQFLMPFVIALGLMFSGPVHAQDVTPTPTAKILVLPIVYGKTDGNIAEIFKETGADTVVIKKGLGGVVGGMMETLVFLEANPNKHVIIDGDCFSACTLLLSKRLHNVCFTPNTKFGFHSASTEGKIDAVSKRINVLMGDVFDVPLQTWLVETRAFDRVDQLAGLTAEDAQKLTNKACPRH